MKLNKIALSAIMAMSVFTGVPAVTSVSAAEDLVYDSDLSDNGTAVPQAWGVTPTPEQYRYQKEELAGFVHFGPNTFNNIEWGENYGDRTSSRWKRISTQKRWSRHSTMPDSRRSS